jgi:PKD repeat protein
MLLEVFDGVFKDVDEFTVTVLNVAPSVDAGPDQTADEGDTVSFAGSFTDPGADTHTIAWDFGDVSPVVSGDLSPTHVYVDDGVYTVTLTVTDDDGGEGVDTLTVTVNNVAPSVDAGPDQTADEGDTVSFTGDFTDLGIMDTHTIEWDFGDGQTALGTLTPTHEYGDNGVYTVTLTVTDDDGGVGVDTLTVAVANVAPTVTLTSDQPNPQFILPSVHEITFAAAFTDPGWLDTHTVSWDFGDGPDEPGTVTEENEAPDSTGSSTASHTYSSTGTYTVTVTFTDDDGGAGSDTYVVVVVTAEEAVQDLDDYIQGLPDEAFKNNPSQRKNALGSMLSEVIDKIVSDDYTGAMNKLDSIRDKADGTGPDWITDPDAQEHVLMKIDDIVTYLALL